MAIAHAHHCAILPAAWELARSTVRFLFACTIASAAPAAYSEPDCEGNMMEAHSTERPANRKRRRGQRNEDHPMSARQRTHHNYEEHPVAPLNREPRRGVRFDSRLLRVVEWEDTFGQTHKLEGTTRVVGAFGCKLMLPHGLPLGQRVSIVDGARSTNVLGTIVWKGKERPEGCEMGVELVAPNMDVWVKEPQLSPGDERRRGQRAVLRLPVLLKYKSHNLEPISVAAHTISVNDHGAMVLCNRAFSAGSELELENRRTWKKVVCRVKRQPKETPEGFQLALEFEQPTLGFWPVAFPPPQ